MNYKILIVIVFSLAFFVLIIPDDVFAHQSGCHRWHSCPSDSGSYTCGDTGYCSQCSDNQYCEGGSPRSSNNDSSYSPSNSNTPSYQSETVKSNLDVSVRANRDIVPAGKSQIIFVTVKSSGTPVSDATVYVNVIYTTGYSRSFEAKTSSVGEAFVTWTIGGNSNPGMFLVKASAQKDGYNTGNAESSFVVTAEKKAEPSVIPKPEPKTSEKPKTSTPVKSSVCGGTGLCISDKVMKIVDGDTIYVKNYKIRLSLTNTPEKDEAGFDEAKSFTAKLCPLRSVITLDQDDRQPYDAYGRLVGKVTCSGKVLNSELLENGYANILTQYCKKSEFSSESWAKKYGCN